MHPFSIDYITREGEVVDKYGARGDREVYDGDREVCRGDGESRHTPSPSDSGMGSDNSPDAEDQKTSDEKDSIEALLALDKKALVHSAPDVNGDKPTHSYIALISMAILSSPEKKMLLCDIYQYIMDNFSFYNNGDKAWRNSIRHNLSLNECFIKNGRADNGKGNYWSIHPACVRDFSKGDFRRRQARRRARKSIREPSNSTFSMPYRYNVGYVPMTASHISFHPYSTGSHSLLYPQSSLASISPSTHAQSQPSSSLLSNPSASSSMYSHGNVPSHSLYPGSPTATPSQQSTISAISAAAVQRYFADETRVALAAQALAPQHLQTPIHFQNW